MARMEKVDRQLQKEISLIIQRELADPRLQFVTITHAQVSKDLRNAKVSFSVMGTAQDIEKAQHGLERASGLIRKYVGQRMDMRYTPELFFVYDDSLERSARIEATLKEINNELKKNQ